MFSNEVILEASKKIAGRVNKFFQGKRDAVLIEYDDIVSVSMELMLSGAFDGYDGEPDNIKLIVGYGYSIVRSYFIQGDGRAYMTGLILPYERSEHGERKYSTLSFDEDVDSIEEELLNDCTLIDIPEEIIEDDEDKLAEQINYFKRLLVTKIDKAPLLASLFLMDTSFLTLFSAELRAEIESRNRKKPFHEKLIRHYINRIHYELYQIDIDGTKFPLITDENIQYGLNTMMRSEKKKKKNAYTDSVLSFTHLARKRTLDALMNQGVPLRKAEAFFIWLKKFKKNTVLLITEEIQPPMPDFTKLKFQKTTRKKTIAPFK